MDPFHFSCPHCSSRLRVREKLYVGRQVDCPECGDTLLIVDRAGELGVECVDRQPEEQKRPGSKKADPAAGEPAAAISPTAVASTARPVPPPDNILRRFFADHRRMLLALGVAAALIAALVAVFRFPGAPGKTGGADGSLQIGTDNGTTNFGGDNPTVQQPLKSPDESEPDHTKNAPPLVADTDERAVDPRISPTGDLLPGVDVQAEGDDDELEADNRPIEPQFAPEPAVPPVRKIDLAAALKQPIARFDQPRTKPLEDVLVSVAEMAGARLTVDREELGPAAARLDEPMALRLENTTVGDILRGLLRPAGLAFRIEGGQLRIVRAE
jgi:hypothetical protein